MKEINLNKGITVSEEEVRIIKQMNFIKVFLNSPMLNHRIVSGKKDHDWNLILPVFETEFSVRIKSEGYIHLEGGDFCDFWSNFKRAATEKKRREILRAVQVYPVRRFTDYLMKHPVTQAYFIGATQGIEAQLPENRINPFSKKKEPKEIEEINLELALLSGALFSTMTEKKRDQYFHILELMMFEGRMGGFKAGAMFRYVCGYDGYQNPKRSKEPLPKDIPHGLIMKTQRYKLYERALFYEVCRHIGDNNDVLDGAEKWADLLDEG